MQWATPVLERARYPTGDPNNPTRKRFEKFGAEGEPRRDFPISCPRAPNHQNEVQVSLVVSEPSITIARSSTPVTEAYAVGRLDVERCLRP